MFKLRVFVILAILFAHLSCAAIAATTWINPGQKSGLYAYDPQYEKYKEIIKTPLRELKVSENFTLVDDFEEFMAWHHENTSGKFPDNRGLITFQSERGLKINECLSNAKTLTGTSAVSSGISEGEFTQKDYTYEYPSAQGRCQNILSQRFMNNPEKGAKDYAEILKYWVENDVLKNINETTKKIPAANARRTDFVYATLSRVGDSLAHYALYHRLYGLSKAEQKQIDAMITSFAKDYDYYTAFKATGSHFSRVCNLGKGATITPNGGNDHCGSFKLRIAVGATLYGLEFGNQVVFDYGIRNLEITLATFDERKAYSAQIHRGMMALGYARQIISELDKLDYAFEKAFNIDFSEMRTPHGTTPAEVYRELLVFANEPQNLSYYFFKNGYGGDRRRGDFKASQKQLKAGKINPEVFWGAFNLEQYFLLGGKMAYDHYPEKFADYINTSSTGKKWSIEGSINTGFNNLVLRQATRQIPTYIRTNRPNFDWSQDKYNGIYELVWSVENVNDPGMWINGAKDTISLANGKGLFINTADGLPGNKSQRAKLEIEYFGDTGKITLSGNLGLFEANRTYSTTIEGFLEKDFIIGTWQEGDRIKIELSKVK